MQLEFFLINSKPGSYDYPHNSLAFLKGQRKDEENFSLSSLVKVSIVPMLHSPDWIHLFPVSARIWVFSSLRVHWTNKEMKMSSTTLTLNEFF